MEQRRVVSADSHFLEPRGLFTERLDKKFRDRAPRTELGSDGITWLTGEDVQPQPLSGWMGAGRASEDLVAVNKMGWDAAPPGALDPAERLKAQDRDGIMSEVLYTSFGMVVMNIRDPELAMACLRVFNDYAADFCSYDPNRLVGIGAVIPDDVGAAVKEIERIRKLGLKGIMLPLTLADTESYGSTKFDPIWAAIDDLGLVVSFHAGTSRAGVNPRPEDWARIYMGVQGRIQLTLTDIIIGGVFDRFPNLKVVSAENDVSWLPHFAYRLDHFAERFVALADIKLERTPTEYIKHHLHAAFQFEGPGIEAVIKTLGSEVIVWGNDFPHLDSTWPKSPEVIDETLVSVLPAPAVDNIVFNNAVKLYGLELAN
jgi:uncharacterized protein